MRPRHSGALGRGLEALLPKRGVRLVEAKLSSIRRGRHQPRVEMNAARLDELTDSIRRHGVLQPLVVTEESDGSGDLVRVSGRRAPLAGRQGRRARNGSSDHQDRRRGIAAANRTGGEPATRRPGSNGARECVLGTDQRVRHDPGGDCTGRWKEQAVGC